DAWMWARQPRQSDGSRPGVSESLRWIEGYERLAEMAPQLPNTRLVYVADREADIMALMVRARDLGEPVDWLLRSKHNRVLGEDDKLWSRVTAGD
ncbi:IS4 family transposase, partial [Verminephrobacter aporrectodeae subsp. tuberculatae]|nr:IS4 family transposase [Verminephrobacter aporrectodeae subsp. tuberculatae]